MEGKDLEPVVRAFDQGAAPLLAAASVSFWNSWSRQMLGGVVLRRFHLKILNMFSYMAHFIHYTVSKLLNE